MGSFAILEDGHRRLQKLSDLIAVSRDTTELRGLLKELRLAFAEHSYIEESVLYPALMELGETHDLAEHSFDDHRAMTDALREVELAQDDREFLDAIPGVLSMMRHHIHEEEYDVLPRAERVFGQVRKDELADEMADARARHAGRAA